MKFAFVFLIFIPFLAAAASSTEQGDRKAKLKNIARKLRGDREATTQEKEPQHRRFLSIPQDGEHDRRHGVGNLKSKLDGLTRQEREAWFEDHDKSVEGKRRLFNKKEEKRNMQGQQEHKKRQLTTEERRERFLSKQDGENRKMMLERRPKNKNEETKEHAGKRRLFARD